MSENSEAAAAGQKRRTTMGALLALNNRIDALTASIDVVLRALDAPSAPFVPLLNLLFVGMDERTRLQRAAGAMFGASRDLIEAECGSAETVTRLLEDSRVKRELAIATAEELRRALVTRLTFRLGSGSA